MKGGIAMDNHSMMELGEDLNGKFNDLVNLAVHFKCDAVSEITC